MRPSDSRRLPVAALLAAAGLWLCGCTTPVTPDEAAEGVVRRFFAQLPEGDCAKLGALVVAGSGETCADAVRELNEHGVRLQEVVSTQVDGRSPDAVLVRARLRYGESVKAQVLRVERHAGTWRLRL
jgi:hypothetical protein